MNVVQQSLQPRSGPGLGPGGLAPTNTLVVPLRGITRAYVYLQKSIESEREVSEVWWTISAWVTLVDPLAPNTSLTMVNLAPSLLDIAPLGAQLMLVAGAFWTGLPEAQSISFKFSTAADEPQGDAQAFGIGDTRPHNKFGLFAAPFGHPRHFERLVDPLPTDPRVLEQLEIAGRIPSPSRAQRPPRR
jgi:hypothetical protein